MANVDSKRQGDCIGSQGLLTIRRTVHAADQTVLCYHPAIINSVNQTV